MNKNLAIASAMLALGLGSTAAQAQQGPQGASLAGSDTLYQVTQDMISPSFNGGAALCPAADTLRYIGGGSGNGENAMIATNGSTPSTNQYVAPMSRFLKTNAVLSGACPTTAQGYNIGLDGLSIVRKHSTATPACSTAAYNRTITLSDGTSYTFRDFRDVLRIVYGGIDHTADAAITKCNIGEPSRAAIGTQNCNSTLRKSIVNNWGNLFQDASCTDAGCTQLKHAFRRGDASGTTDTFLTILAMPKIAATVKPFCNGKDQEDIDPIRRSCTGNGASGGEQVCQPRNATALAYPADQTIALRGGALNNSDPWLPAADNTGDLGVVLDINVPEGVAVNISHNTTDCNFGDFDFVHMDPIWQALGTRCPNGTPLVVLKCLWPKDAAGNFGCLNNSLNEPQIGELKKIDARAYNLVLRQGSDTNNNIVKDKNNAYMSGAFYRLHENQVMPNAGAGAIGCTYADSTAQIGCLVQASPCSIGFAGREAADDTTIAHNDVDSLAIGAADNSVAVLPTDLAVQKLLVSDATCTGGVLATRYPLARKLWLQSTVGFSDPRIPADQQALATCESDRSKMDKAITNNGFILLPQPAGLSVATCAQATSAADLALCQLPIISGGANCL